VKAFRKITLLRALAATQIEPALPWRRLLRWFLFIVPGFSGTGAFARHLFLRGRWREPTRAKRIDDSFEQEAITNQAIGMTIIATPRMSKRLGLAADPAPRFSRWIMTSSSAVRSLNPDRTTYTVVWLALSLDTIDRTQAST
jgi:hypothetical protein